MTTTAPPRTLPFGPPRLRSAVVPLAEAVVAAPAVCPECGGGWMRALTFDHAVSCQLRDQQDSSAARDAEAFRRGRTSATTRTVSPGERRLGAALAVPATARTATSTVDVRLSTPGLAMMVRMGGFELSRLVTAEELAALNAVVSA